MDDFEWTDEQGDKGKAYVQTFAQKGENAVIAGVWAGSQDGQRDQAVWLTQTDTRNLRDWLDERLREVDAPRQDSNSCAPSPVRPQWGDLHLFGYHCRIYNETVDLALSPHSDGRDLIFVPNVKTTPHIETVTGRFTLEVDVGKALDAIHAYQVRTGR